MYKDYSSLVQFQLDKITKVPDIKVNIPTPTLKLADIEHLTTLSRTINSLEHQIKVATSFSNSSYLRKNIEIARKISERTSVIQNSPKLNIEKIKSATELKPINIKIPDFSKSLFSEETSDFVKKSIDVDSKTIDTTFNLLRYEYVKNTLINAKSIRRIEWEPVTAGFREYMTQIQTYNAQCDSNQDKEIQKLSPQLSLLISSLFQSSLFEDLKPFITFLANELLPFVPPGIRNTMLLAIIFVAAFNKLDKD
ncbi:TPA: hypothetical protein PJ751_002520 [Staphylococcus aureus]|nr:hypothetical protein [Staphylococcus aureus]HDB7927948.1 hypothetical protein [Staphylococcus aureus]HDC3667075.1 hypothetical protein [Staphylococcus aureus]HDC3680552.1 hypothetical protein [Staphylococcus aureus]HDI0333513.1 hypothetical protein [Staphylococcus aureus]